MSGPLTFADFLPDDRSPERKTVDAMREEIAAFMRSDMSDLWQGWQALIQRMRGEADIDRALFDLALRMELVDSRRHAPPKPVLGLIFTEMDWWEPKGGYEKRKQDLLAMVDAFELHHLRPKRTDPKPFDGQLFDDPHSLSWVVWLVIFTVLVVVLSG